MGVKRINITLPKDVIEILKRETSTGEKSSYIADAIRAYSKGQSKKSMLQEMIKGYVATSQEDLEEAEVWENTLNDRFTE